MVAIFTDRPRVGCRHVARDNTQKIVQKTVEGLADWNADVRIKSAQVLGTFITYAGAQMTGYTGVILPALYRILAGDECSVMKEVVLSLSQRDSQLWHFCLSNFTIGCRRRQVR